VPRAGENEPSGLRIDVYRPLDVARQVLYLFNVDRRRVRRQESARIILSKATTIEWL